MPMIDVTAPVGTFRPEVQRPLAEALTDALLTAERAPRTDMFRANTGFFLHELPRTAVHTSLAAGPDTVRVQVLTPPDAVSGDAQQELVAAATAAVAEHASAEVHTWVLLTEAAEGGWGIAGRALGKADFAALAGAV